MRSRKVRHIEKGHGTSSLSDHEWNGLVADYGLKLDGFHVLAPLTAEEWGLIVRNSQDTIEEKAKESADASELLRALIASPTPDLWLLEKADGKVYVLNITQFRKTLETLDDGQVVFEVKRRIVDTEDVPTKVLR